MLLKSLFYSMSWAVLISPWLGASAALACDFDSSTPLRTLPVGAKITVLEEIDASQATIGKPPYNWINFQKGAVAGDVLKLGIPTAAFQVHSKLKPPIKIPKDHAIVISHA